MALVCRLLPPLGSLLLLGAWLLTDGTLPPVAAEECSGGLEKMIWKQITNEAALCNDYTRAGYFLSRRGTDKWLIFFEGGSLCYSNDTCNRRFFQRSVRDRFSVGPSMDLFGNFSTEEAWRGSVLEAENRAEAGENTVSPLMSSLSCFQGNPNFFPPEQRAAAGEEFAVQGRDILDCDCSVNPVFCDYNAVLVPYCSSDLWLGGEEPNGGTGSSDSCECFEYAREAPSDRCGFRFDPTSPGLQFAFRGRTIFRSVINDLMAAHNISEGSEVVLAGSSAGGVGVVNNARWVSERFADGGRGRSDNLRVVFDSAWFINFQGSINREFTNVRENAAATQPDADGAPLFGLIAGHEACTDPHRGYPCCLSVDCLFTRSANSTGLPYYPPNVPTFGIVSLYDVFLLAPSLAGLAPDDDGGDNSSALQVGVLLDFITTVAEYGGAMNASVVRATEYMNNASGYLSLYLTSCLQHIYLATSTLWGPEGQSVFGSDAVELTGGMASFS